MGIGGIVITILSYARFESRDENGITYVIKKRHQEETVLLDVGAKKFINSSIVVGTGLPVGREAPALLIGSAIASKIVKLAKIPEDFQYQAITLGGAASTGALFQAPFVTAVLRVKYAIKICNGYLSSDNPPGVLTVNPKKINGVGLLILSTVKFETSGGW